MIHTLAKKERSDPLSSDVIAELEDEMSHRGTREFFLLFALGSQFDDKIKKRIEQLGFWCIVADPATITAADVEQIKPIGIILSGGQASVYDKPPPFDTEILDLGISVLGICLGLQIIAKHIGVQVVPSPNREFGGHVARVTDHTQLFEGLPETMSVLESHGDRVEPDKRLRILATTENAPVAAANYRHLWGVQFHPEVVPETEHGVTIFENFCVKICGAKDRFPAEDIAQQKIAKLREELAGKRIVIAGSGGVDSSTCIELVGPAINREPGRVRVVYIKGSDRPDDERHVLEHFGNQPWIELVIVDATDRFLAALVGAKTMREKRVAMRGVYKEVLEEQIADFGADCIVQGTLYTDISESGGGHAGGEGKAQIKLHHNVGLGFSVPEICPLDDCYKDGGRAIGRQIGVAEGLLSRHPFPGPGLIVRVEGEVTADKLRIARQADEIYIEELRRWELYDSVWQAGAVVTQSVTTCTKGDDAASGLIVALWAVWSVDGFTARAAELPWAFLKRVAQRLTNEIREVGAVVYRVSDKPPTTIEWG